MALSEISVSLPGWTSPAEDAAKTERYEAHICHRYLAGLTLSKTDERDALRILIERREAEDRKIPYGHVGVSLRKARQHIKSALERRRQAAIAKPGSI